MDMDIKLRVKVDVENLIEILFALCDRFELSIYVQPKEIAPFVNDFLNKCCQHFFGQTAALELLIK